MIIKLNQSEIVAVSGAGAWDSFWEAVGEGIGSYMASSAYSSYNRELHQKTENGDLQSFLDSQNDPLL